MNIATMHIEVKIGLDKSAALELPAFEPEEIDIWLNKGIRRFSKTRYSGVNPKNQSALMLAAFNGHTQVVELLLSHGAEVNLCDNAGRTALIYAASGSNEVTVELLLEKQANVNIADKVESWTALMFAAAEGQTKIVKLLLGYQADWTMTDVDGETARDFADNKRHTKTVEVIDAFIQSKATN